MQHRPLLGEIDLLALKHRLDAVGRWASWASRSSRARVSSVTRFFRIVDVEPRRLQGEPLASSGVVGKQLAQCAGRGPADSELRAALQTGSRVAGTPAVVIRGISTR